MRIRKCKKLTKKCPCSPNTLGRRIRRSPDGSFVQKCSVVNGAVECSQLQTGLPWDEHKKELDSLIEQYREQLKKLKDLRKDIQSNFGNVDYDKYRLSSSPDTSTATSVLYPNVTSLSSASMSSRLASYEYDEEVEECLCADENDLKEYDLSPSDLIDEEALEEEDDLDTPNDPDNLSRKEQKRLERKLKRQEKKLERQRQKHKVEECDRNDRRCLRKQRKKLQQYGKRNNPHCQVEGAECTVMDNDHWKTEPRWTLGPFCFCNNAQSNVFWCLRTINETHNFLYCEYINGFLTYYDAATDPWMLRNAIHDLPYPRLRQLHDLLLKQRTCRGAKECTYRHREKLPFEPLSEGRSTAFTPRILSG